MHRAAVAAMHCTCNSHIYTYRHTFARIYSAKYTESHTYIRCTRTGCSETARHLKATRVSSRRFSNPKIFVWVKLQNTMLARVVHLNEELNGTEQNFIRSGKLVSRPVIIRRYRILEMSAYFFLTISCVSIRAKVSDHPVDKQLTLNTTRSIYTLPNINMYVYIIVGCM